MSASKPRGVLIAGNWKMNLGPAETGAFFRELRAKAPAALASDDLALLRAGSLRACVIPPMPSLAAAQGLTERAPFPLAVAAQNAHWEKSGAFTGEVSGPMLRELGIGWALVGHSERRQYFGETDETARKRAESLLAQGFTVIFCIGETRREREDGKTHDVLARQIAEGCPRSALSALEDGRLILAYEPVWAIGTGLTATPEQAQEAHRFARDRLGDRYGKPSAERAAILYGGSVTPANIDGLLRCPDIDGGLVGGASLKPESFLALLTAGGRALRGA